MAVKESNKRITLTIDKTLFEKVEKLAGYQNVSVNATINTLIETSIDAQIKLWELLKSPDSMEMLIKAAANLDPSKLKDLKAINNKMATDKNQVKEIDELMEKLK